MRDIKLLTIQSIVGDAGYGGTCPIIVKANDKEYVLKTKEDGTNPKSLGIFNELLAYQLLEYLGTDIAPQEVVFLFINDDFIEMAEIACEVGGIKKESLDFIQDSLGVNIGIEYLHFAQDTRNLKIDNELFVKDIAHIDNYIMNCDRTEDNSNILQDTRNLKKYYAIDFGNALADAECYKKIQNGEANIFITGAYSHCNATQSGRYLLRNDTKRLVKRGRYIKDNMVTVRQILADIINTFPSEWEPVLHKDAIVDVISTRLKSRKIFEVTDISKCKCIY